MRGAAGRLLGKQPCRSTVCTDLLLLVLGCGDRERRKMSLSVLVKSASSLPNVERFSKSDPMCVIILQGA